jgi:hypothetical protein
MNIYTFVAEPSGVEFIAAAATEKEAHQKVWDSLTDAERDACECLEWVDEKEGGAA